VIVAAEHSDGCVNCHAQAPRDFVFTVVP